MVKNINPSFVQYFAAYLKKLLSNKTGTITAEQFQEQVTSAVNDYLKEHYNVDAAGVRSAIAQSTPEIECANAIKARNLHGIGEDVRISDYKMQAEISGSTNVETLGEAKKKYVSADNNERGLVIADWNSSTNISLPDMRKGKDGIPVSNKKRQETVPFKPMSAVNCGQCWICKTDVMSYSGPSIEKYDAYDIQNDNGNPIECTTPCGDCEHVSAVMASYIAGMLKSGGFAKFYWASYYVACVECNRKKSNYIGVKLNATNGWEVDADGVNAILNAIFPNGNVAIHGSEYNPIRNALTRKYNTMPPAEKFRFKDKVRRYIEEGTETWCYAANENMKKSTAISKNIKMSFNVSRIIAVITGHLEVIMGPLQKKANRISTGKSASTGKSTSTGKRRGQVKNNSTGKRRRAEKTNDPRSGKKARKTGGGPHDDVIKSDMFRAAEDEIDDFINIMKVDDIDIDMGILAENTYRDYQYEYLLHQISYYSSILYKEYQSNPDDFTLLINNLLMSMQSMTNMVIDTGEVLDEGTQMGIDKSTSSSSAMSSTAQATGAAMLSSSEFDRAEPGGTELIGKKAEDKEKSDMKDSPTRQSVPSSVEFTPAAPKKNSDSQEPAYADADDDRSGINLAYDFTQLSQSQGKGGRVLNKRHTKNNSQKRSEKKRVRLISYNKHNKTRKNQHSIKTK